MKNKRFLSIVMATALVGHAAFLPIWAEEPDAAAVPATVSQQETAAEGTQDPSSGTQPTQTQVAAPPTTLPADFNGDASIELGSRTIDARTPVIDPSGNPIKSKAAIAYEVGTDTLVYANNVDTRLFPASMTKIMTCLVALEMGDLNEVITVDGDAIAYLDAAGSGAGLKGGEQLTLEELLYCLMVKSANDAAVTIAVHLAGSEEAFVERMNQKAVELGCTDTNFVNSHGLHNDNHYTTARDMAKIMAACIENETFNKLYSEPAHVVPATNLSEERTLYSTNYLMSEALNQNYYDSRVIGGKTGFTTPAGRCLVSVSESNGMKLITVIMGAEATFAEDGYTALSYGHFDATVQLMNLVYNGYKPVQVLAENQILEQFPVNDGQTDGQGYVTYGTSTVVPNDSDVASLRYEYILDNGGISAPVKAGDPIGLVRVWMGNRCAAQQKMYASVDVEKKVLSPASSKPVNPASTIQEDSSLFNQILIVVLGVLAVAVVVAVIMQVRRSMIRARRKKRRAMARRRRS